MTPRDAGSDAHDASVVDVYVPTSGSPSGSGAADAAPVPCGSLADAGKMHREAGALVLTGCAATVPTAVFGARCTNNLCHNAHDMIVSLDLQSPGIAARLMGVPALEDPTSCILDPYDPDRSYLLVKLEPNPPLGSEMPFGSSLSAAQIACVKQWIEAEAAAVP